MATENQLAEELAKKRQIKAQHEMEKAKYGGEFSMANEPQTLRLNLPFNIDSIDDVDQEMISMLFMYKMRVQENRDEQWEDKISEMKSTDSEEARELASFAYDHLDEFEEVLDEEEYDELESLIMSVK